MISIRKVTESDLAFINELMKIAKKEATQGLAYPCWDLEGNFNEINQTITKQMLIIENNAQPVGTIGIFDAPWGKYLVGPAVTQEFHLSDNLTNILHQFKIDFQDDLPNLEVDIKNTNVELADALTRSGFTIFYSGVSMYYDLENHDVEIIFEEIEDIYADEEVELEAINAIFTADLKPWQGKTVDNLIKAIENDLTVTAIYENAEIVGAIVWTYDDGSGSIDYICIGSDYQLKGYATQLLGYVKNIAFADIFEGAENKIHLDVDRTNLDAKTFYLKQGFEIDYERDVYKLKTD